MFIFRGYCYGYSVSQFWRCFIDFSDLSRFSDSWKKWLWNFAKSVLFSVNQNIFWNERLQRLIKDAGESISKVTLARKDLLLTQSSRSAHLGTLMSTIEKCTIFLAILMPSTTMPLEDTSTTDPTTKVYDTEIGLPQSKFCSHCSVFPGNLC